MSDLPYHLMHRGLTGEIPAPVWPPGMHLKPFSLAHAPEAHALLELAYANGGGSVPPFDQWWSALSADSEFDPALCFPVFDDSGALIAFAQCWTSNFVKDLAVHPAHRGRGLGRSLLLHIFQVFKARGAKAVELKVQKDNPSGAMELYERSGMHFA